MEQPTPSTPPEVSLMGPKVLLEGPSGTGKTYALGTLVDWAAKNSMEVFALFTENGLESLLGYWKDKGLAVPECLHYHSTLTKPLSLDKLINAAEQVGLLSYDALTKLVDPTRGGENNAFRKILTACNDFPDDRTGKKFGSVEKFDHTKIFIIDSLTELSNAVMKMVVGSKPTAAPSDYMVAQSTLRNFLGLCTQGSKYTFVLIAHVGRETDEISGTTKLMTQAIGKAMSGDIPRYFSDVIFTVREGQNFYWDTAALNVDIKTRSLPIQSKLKPDFAPLLEKWKVRGT